MVDVPLDPTPPILLNNPPCIIVQLAAIDKLVVASFTITYPRNIAFVAVFGASVNTSLSLALIAVNKFGYVAVP